MGEIQKIICAGVETNYLNKKFRLKLMNVLDIVQCRRIIENMM